MREIYFTFENPLKKTYYFLFRPKTRSVRIIIIDNDRVLLLRAGYGSKKWVIPGGKVNRGEDYIMAAKRELKEESGLEINEIVSIGSYYSELEHKKETEKFFAGETSNEDLTIDDQEIIDAGWFAFDELPENRVSVVDDGIKLYNDWKHGKN